MDKIPFPRQSKKALLEKTRPFELAMRLANTGLEKFMKRNHKPEPIGILKIRLIKINDLQKFDVSLAGLKKFLADKTTKLDNKAELIKFRILLK